MAYTPIDKSNDYFNTIIYTGNNNQSQTISGVGFQPDWIWIKNSDNTEWHHLMDAVRGDNKFLHTNTTGAESTGNRGNGHNALAFTSDGFSITNATQQDGDLNFGSRPYPTWCWKAGGSPSSNTDGSITSSVSANTTSGFSIVSYTGTGAVGDIGHGLGSTPKMIIKKRRNGADAWNVWHESLGDGSKALYLNTTNATDTNANYASNVPTSSLFYVGTDSQINASGGTYIAYCFAEVKGFSKFGSYTGNGNADGTFVYTGFKPAFVLLKSSSSGAVGWITHDNKRIGFNPNNYYVEPNNTNAESADTDKILLLSNGFKLISTSTSWNASSATYIYMAFAEQPFVTSTANGSIPATAR
jgi:hypothetical protein